MIHIGTVDITFLFKAKEKTVQFVISMEIQSLKTLQTIFHLYIPGKEIYFMSFEDAQTIRLIFVCKVLHDYIHQRDYPVQQKTEQNSSVYTSLYTMFCFFLSVRRSLSADIVSLTRLNVL